MAKYHQPSSQQPTCLMDIEYGNTECGQLLLCATISPSNCAIGIGHWLLVNNILMRINWPRLCSLPATFITGRLDFMNYELQQRWFVTIWLRATRMILTSSQEIIDWRMNQASPLMERRWQWRYFSQKQTFCNERMRMDGKGASEGVRGSSAEWQVTEFFLFFFFYS